MKYDVLVTEEDDYSLEALDDGRWRVERIHRDDEPTPMQGRFTATFSGSGAEGSALSMWNELNCHEVTQLCEYCEVGAGEEYVSFEDDSYYLCKPCFEKVQAGGGE